MVSTTLRVEVSGPLDAPAVVRRFYRRFSTSPRVRGPYEVHLSREDVARTDGPFSRQRTHDRLARLVPKLDVGERLRVVSRNGHRFKVHAVEIDPAPVHDVPGSPNVRRWVAILRERWPGARLAGTCVCKDDSTGKCNGHRDCAAADDFDTDANMIAQRDYLIEHANELGVSYVILHDRIWTFGEPRTFSSRGTRLYTGDYHYHVHASFDDGTCGIACGPSSGWPR